MTVWIAVLAVGLVSFTLRVVPFLLAERVPMTPGFEDGLRHAGMGAVAALLVGSVTSPALAGDVPATVVALAVASLLVFLGRSMTLAVTAGALVFAVASALG